MLENGSTVPGKVIQMIKVKEQPPEQPVESAAEKAIRIRKLREQIDDGTYQIPAADLAERMMERLEWQ